MGKIYSTIFSKEKWVFLFCFFIVFIILAPVLTGFNVVGTDALELNIPQMAFYKYSFETGQSPFWNPYIAVGFPNFVSIQGFPYTPFNLLLYFFSPVTLHYWGIFFMLSLAMSFFILFCKRLGISTYGSLLGAMGYLIGNIFFARDVFLATTLFLQTGLFWVVISVYQAKKKRDIFLLVILGSLFIGYGWLTAAYFQTLYILTVVFAFSIYLGLKKSQDGSRNKNQFYKILKSFIVMCLIGAIIGSFQLVPTYVISKYSQRSSGFDYNQAQGWALGIKDFLNFTHLTSARGLDAYLYMGIIPLMLLFFSFFIRKNSWVNFFRWFFIIALAAAIKKSPIFWLIVHLPIFNFFQGAGRFMLVGAFAGGVLASFGFEHLIHTIKKSAIESIRISQIFFTITSTLMMLTVILWSNWEETYTVVVSAIFLIMAYLAVIFLYKNCNFLTTSLILLTALDFVLVFYNFNKDYILDRDVYEKAPDSVDLFRNMPGRILPLFVDDWDNLYFNQALHADVPKASPNYRFSLESPTYRPLYQLLNQIENIEINDPLLNVNLGRLLALLGTRQLVTTGGEIKLDKIYSLDENSIDVSVPERFKLLAERKPLVDFLGIKYLLTPITLNNYLILTSFPMRFYGTSENDPLLEIIIYVNPDARPPVYFSDITEILPESEQIHKRFKENGFKEILVECSQNCPNKVHTAKGDLRINRRENGLIGLTTSSAGDQFLIFTQNYLPGWEAFIDGQKTPILTVNNVFMGVAIPAGQHNVDFNYNYWNLFDPKLVLAK